MRWLAVAIFALALAACQRGGMGSDHFAPGTWRIEAWMESAQGSTRGQPGATLTDTVKLTAEEADGPPATVFFSHFYHGVGEGDIRFSGGRIEGSFHQRGVDDISAHEVPVSGSYASDHFRVTFGYKAFGMTMNQVAEGKLIDPLP